MNQLIALAALVLACVPLHAAPKPPDYRTISFRDFQIDGPQLARDIAPIQITGAYTKPGNLDLLYANASDASIATYSASAYAQQLPFIPLLTDSASHGVREAMYDCRSRNAVGCLLTLRGLVSMCTVTNGFGAAHETPCLEVFDGAAYIAPPRPQPAQQQQQQQQQPKIIAPPTSTAAEIPPGPASEKRIRDCVQSAEMANEADVYRKCQARVLGYKSSAELPSSNAAP